MSQPPDGYRLRTARLEDAAALADLINACTLVEAGMSWTSADELRDDLTIPGRDREQDDAVLVADDGSVAGYLQLFGDIEPYTEIEAMAFVHPDLWGRGLSTFLLEVALERGSAKVDLAPPGKRVVLFVARWKTNEAAGRLFASFGFAYVRTFWTMRIELDHETPSPTLPSGVAIRSFDRERDEWAVYETIAAAFADHWGNSVESFEQWIHFEIEGESSRYDPTLWFLAVEGERIVGAAICRLGKASDPEAAHVSSLGVRRDWRGRGIGLALLHAAFEEFRRRGVPRAELGVDADSPTGATRLYERAGMHVAYAAEFWEKELRAAAG